MRKFFIVFVSLFVISLIAISLIFHRQEENLTKIRLAEVARTIFYAPQYVAIKNGYFKEEGLDIELILTPGADKVMAAVLSNDVQIGLSGAEATIYVYKGGEKDYIQTFAQLTQKDGSFIVSRRKIENFKLDDLRSKHIIGGRRGGMPVMTFQWILKQHNINPNTDLTIDTSIAFPAMSGAFIGGLGDFVNLFEPTASMVERQGFGYIVASIGELGGKVPYTAYSARKSFINANPEIMEGFTKAIYRGQQFVYENSPEDVAKIIYEYFPDTSMNDIINVIRRYKEIEAWSPTPKLNEESFDHLQNIMISAEVLETKVPFSDLVNNDFAEKATK